MIETLTLVSIVVVSNVDYSVGAAESSVFVDFWGIYTLKLADLTLHNSVEFPFVDFKVISSDFKWFSFLSRSCLI